MRDLMLPLYRLYQNQIYSENKWFIILDRKFTSKTYFCMQWIYPPSYLDTYIHWQHEVKKANVSTFHHSNLCKFIGENKLAIARILYECSTEEGHYGLGSALIVCMWTVELELFYVG